MRLISVIMPVLNEAECIQKTLDSLLQQSVSDIDLEFILVDGGSTDGTREIIEDCAARDGRLRLLNNPRKKTPAGLNIGLHAARGEFVCILGAHAQYPRDYICICLQELLAHAATGCSGRLVTVPANTSTGARLAAWCLGHRYASSGSSARTHRGGFVDSIPYPLMYRRALLEVGGYDEELGRNQDNDMNYRLRQRGHKLYLTPLTCAYYRSRPSVSALLTYAFQTGRWNAITLFRTAASMSRRHFLPLIFLMSLIILGASSLLLAMRQQSPALPLGILAFLLALHLLRGLVATLETFRREHAIAALALPAVILAFHIIYGAGTMAGFLRGFGRHPMAPRPQSVTEVVTQ
jgi:succinoglycan biosynthesis protein ExoA